ncbi:MAG: S8 family serine peptidase, partial [Myxococcota bacterium]
MRRPFILILVVGLTTPAWAQTTKPDDSPRVRVLVGLPLEDEQRRDTIRTLSDFGIPPLTTLPFLAAVEVRRSEIPALRELENVRWVEEDLELRFTSRQSIDCSAVQWPLGRGEGFPDAVDIRVEDAWLETTGFFVGGGTRVRVAVVDDGLEASHPEFTGRVIAEANFSDDGLASSEIANRDSHGTQTAGVIGAARDGTGVDGVCPDCALLSARLLGNGGPDNLYSTSSLAAAQAITWAVDQGSDVIANAWGPPDGNPNTPDAPRITVELPPALDDALGYALREGRDGLGTVIVWSAGNGGEPIGYDAYASDPRVLSVGSIAADARRAGYSDWGSALDLVTPSSGSTTQPGISTADRIGALGSSALNAGACAAADSCDEVCLEDYTRQFGGTSASAGHVAGAAALLLAHRPDLTAAQVFEALQESAVPLDSIATENGFSPRYGYGRLDARAALDRAASYDGALTRGFEMCANGLDDNGDGQVDEGCEPCVVSGAEVCDGEDNDCYGFVDPGDTCSDTLGFCAPCERSDQCADGFRCRTSEASPGKFCVQRCDGGESCPEGTQCRDGDTC